MREHIIIKETMQIDNFVFLLSQIKILIVLLNLRENSSSSVSEPETQQKILVLVLKTIGSHYILIKICF